MARLALAGAPYLASHVVSGVSAIEYIILASAVAIGATAHGAIGVGFAFVATPVIAMVDPAAVPATVLLLGLPLSTAIAVFDRQHIDARSLPALFGGRIGGTAVAVAILSQAPQERLTVIFGCALVSAAWLATAKPLRAGTAAVKFLAGVASGVLGTTVGAGAAPLAIAYRDAAPVVVRSTLSVIVVAGIALSLGALAITGLAGSLHLRLAASLLPAVVIGTVAGHRIRLDAASSRRLIVTFAGLSGVVLVLRGSLS